MRKWIRTMQVTATGGLAWLSAGSAWSGVVNPPPIDRLPSPAIPEPSAIAIFALGAATVAFAVRKRRRR